MRTAARGAKKQQSGEWDRSASQEAQISMACRGRAECHHWCQTTPAEKQRHSWTACMDYTSSHTGSDLTRRTLSATNKESTGLKHSGRHCLAV